MKSEMCRRTGERTEDFGIDDACALAKRLVARDSALSEKRLVPALLPWDELVALGSRISPHTYESIKRMRAALTEAADKLLELRLSTRGASTRRPSETERSRWIEMILEETRKLVQQMLAPKKR